MLEQELKNIWKGSAQAEKIKFDLSRLLIEFTHKMNNIEKTIRRRDQREIAASVIGIPIFAYFAYEIPFIVTKMACLFAICWFFYVIYRFKSLQKYRHTLDLTLPFKEQLTRQKNYMVKQANLLDTVLYWYVLPPFLMNVIFILGIGDPKEYNWEPLLLDLLPVSTQEKVTTIIMLVIFYSVIVWINKRAAKKTLIPVIDEIHHIEQVQQELGSKE